MFIPLLPRWEISSAHTFLNGYIFDFDWQWWKFIGARHLVSTYNPYAPDINVVLTSPVHAPASLIKIRKPALMAPMILSFLRRHPRCVRPILKIRLMVCGVDVWSPDQSGANHERDSCGEPSTRNSRCISVNLSGREWFSVLRVDRVAFP